MSFPKSLTRFYMHYLMAHKWWLVCFFCLSNPTVAFGNVDKREYVDWQSPRFSRVVKIASDDQPTTFCTGQFVSPTIVITNAHCVGRCDHTDFSKCYIKISDGQEQHVKLVLDTRFYEKFVKTSNEYNDLAAANGGTAKDYAFLRVIDPGFLTDDFYRVRNEYYTGPVTMAGFGNMRIISDEELKLIRTVYIKNVIIPLYRENWQKNRPNMKWEKYVKKYVPSEDYIDRSMIIDPEKLDNALVENGMEPIFEDSERLKLSNNCNITVADSSRVDMDCQSASGNSGSGLIDPVGSLVGLLNSAKRNYDATKISDSSAGLAAPVFYDDYLLLIDAVK